MREARIDLTTAANEELKEININERILARFIRIYSKRILSLSYYYFAFFFPAVALLL